MQNAIDWEYGNAGTTKLHVSKFEKQRVRTVKVSRAHTSVFWFQTIVFLLFAQTR